MIWSWTQLYENIFLKRFSGDKKNNGNAENVKLTLENIIPHAYREHNNCGSFCTTNENGVHIYKYFKDGKCLTDLNLKEKLLKIIQPYINPAPQIADWAFSQNWESFNMTVTTKHSKSSFYDGSESYTFRVTFGVYQKNYGYT